MTDDSSERERTTARQRRRFALSGVEQRVLRRYRGLGLTDGTVVLVGFSGGPDSLCLAVILARIANAGRFIPRLLHVNHKLRLGADQEAEHARMLADALGLTIEVTAPKVSFGAVYPNVGIEEAARRGRYLALATAARDCGAGVVAIAHHQSDQAETVLMHLLRGAGMDGVAGMHELSSLSVPWWTDARHEATTLRLWRPLLAEPENEISAYVSKLDFEPNRDSSNAEERFQRNAIRHQVLPALERVFPTARDALSRFAEIAGGEDDLLSQLTEAALQRVLTPDGTLLVDRLVQEHISIQRRLMLRWLRSRTRTSEISLERVLAVLANTHKGDEGPRLEIAAGFIATMLGRELACDTPEGLLAAAWARFPGPRADDAPEQIILPPESTLDFGSLRFETGHRVETTGIEGVDWIRLPANASGQRLWLRRLKPDDRLTLGGPPVRDWLRRHRVPFAIRNDLIAIANADGVLWIPGLPLPARNQQNEDPGSIVRWIDERQSED